MGGTYVAETAPGATAGEALAALAAKFKAENDQRAAESGYEDWDGWLDPQYKCASGYVELWHSPVSDCAIEWTRGWCEQRLPRDPKLSEPGGKFGPWLAFPLESGGWHFFGWVNT
jgi:hypothetical protein